MEGSIFIAFKHKFSYEEKVKILTEYQNGTYGFRKICQVYKINQGSLKNWICLYETFGIAGLQTGNKAQKYSVELKICAINDCTEI